MNIQYYLIVTPKTVNTDTLDPLDIEYNIQQSNNTRELTTNLLEPFSCSIGYHNDYPNKGTDQIVINADLTTLVTIGAELLPSAKTLDIYAKIPGTTEWKRITSLN